MTDYKLKLKALLHDPVDKQYVMWKLPVDKQYVMWKLKRKHEDVAREYLNEILYGEPLKDGNIKDADIIASAISRIVVLSEDERIKKKIENFKPKWEEIEFIDIFSLKKEKAQGPENENEVKKFFERLGSLNFRNVEEKAELCFLFLWRFLPEIFPWLNKHPADSRAPNHSIYDHLVQTSAIVSCLPKPVFLLFTIGPVQQFISRARKTLDLWSGSYLLSYLTFKAIEKILEELGPDNIIYPNLLGQPLVDRWLYEKFKNTPIEQNFKEENYFKKFIDNCVLYEKLTIANFPNRFLAIIPYDKSLGKKVEEKVKEELKSSSQKVEVELKRYLPNLTIGDKIKTHLLSYFQIYWVILPWIKDKPNSPDEALGDYKEIISGDTKLYKTVELIINNPFYKPPSVGSAYSLLLELTERLLGARKSIRNYIENNYYESGGEKCDLCGEFDVLILDPNNNKGAWNELPRDIVKEGERLCGVCLTKRLFPKIFKNLFKNLSDHIEIKFPSTSEIAGIGEKRRLDQLGQKVKEKFKEEFERIFKSKNLELPKSVSVPKLKGDPLYEIDGEWLMKETYRVEYFQREYGLDISENDFKDILDFIEENKISPSKYYAILMMDGDDMGKWLKGEFNPKIEEVLDTKIKDILKEVNDNDLNSILCSRHPVSASIHQTFSRRLSNFALEEVRKIVEENRYGKLIYAGGDDILAFLPLEDILECSFELQKKFKDILGPKSSMSAGIVISHHKYPLYLALDEVRDAEKMAKEKFGKNAFCIKLIKHSGEIRETGGKWDLIEFIEDLICKFRTEKIPSRFPYEFLEVVEKIEDKEILKAELKRIYYRKVKEDMKNYLDEIIKSFDAYNYDKIYFANMFLISKFLADERKV